MRQAAAILVDSVRELRSRSLFWIALAISVLVSLMLFGMISFNDQGWRILWFATNESQVLREGTPAKRDLLSWLFGGALLWWWLTWGAIVLALITTANTIPEFVSGGAIDLVLSKPIGRARLYATKLLSAMLFMILQVAVCVTIAYLLAGLRFGIWFHAAWLALPLVTLQFLYLFAVMSLAGLVTRSALASLLTALLFWGVVSIVQFAANQLEKVQVEAQHSISQAEERIESIRARAREAGRDLTALEQSRIEGIENRVQPMRTILKNVEPWQGPVQRFELAVPKTADIQKIIAEEVKAPTFSELMMRLQGLDPEMMAKFANMEVEEFRDAQRAGIAGERAMRQVNPWKSIGSSLVFTGLVLALSLWIFARRDF